MFQRAYTENFILLKLLESKSNLYMSKPHEPFIKLLITYTI